MYKIVQEIDSEAFIIEFDVNSVKGGVLRHYINKKKNKKLKEFKTTINKKEHF